MSLRKNYKTDKKAEIEGVSVIIGINDNNGQPMSITVARMSPSNKRYTKALQAATKPYEASLQMGNMDNELGRKILQRVFAETILLGWDNIPLSDVTDKDEDEGKIAEYSVENALALFELMPDAYDSWESIAQKGATFKEAVRDNAVKN